MPTLSRWNPVFGWGAREGRGRGSLRIRVGSRPRKRGRVSTLRERATMKRGRAARAGRATAKTSPTKESFSDFRAGNSPRPSLPAPGEAPGPWHPEHQNGKERRKAVRITTSSLSQRVLPAQAHQSSPRCYLATASWGRRSPLDQFRSYIFGGPPRQPF